MKKTILLSFVIAIASFSFAQAQCLTTSYGVTQTWSVPYNVYSSVYHDYYGYDVVHSTRYLDNGYGHFEVVLQKGNVFVRVNVDAQGHIHRRVVSSYNPIVNHSCSTQCGFHSGYYTTHKHNFHKNVYVYNVNNHEHYNNGHNGYHNGNKHNNQSYGNSNNHSQNNNSGRGNGNAYGHSKGNNGNAYGHNKGNNGQGRGNSGQGNGNSQGNGGRGSNRIESPSNGRTSIAYNDASSSKTSYPSRRQ